MISDEAIKAEQRANDYIMRIVQRLAAPFSPDRVKWRVGATRQGSNGPIGLALAYVDSRDIMERLDEEVGPQNWRDELVCVDGRWICTIYLRLPIEPYHRGEWAWVGKSDGAGETDVEPAKGGASDAFKRAAVKWGPGRDLYSLDSPWVELDGKRIAKHERQRLNNLILGLGDPNLRTSEPEPEPPQQQQAAPKAEAPAPSGPRITDAQRKLLYRTNFACAEKAGIDTKNDKDRAFECVNYAVQKLGYQKIDELRKDDVSKAIHFMNEWMEQQKNERSHPLSKEDNQPGLDDEPPPPDDGDGFGAF